MNKERNLKNCRKTNIGKEKFSWILYMANYKENEIACL